MGTIAEKKIAKSQSEAFMLLRKKIQNEMKDKNFTYNKDLQEVEKKRK